MLEALQCVLYAICNLILTVILQGEYFNSVMMNTLRTRLPGDRLPKLMSQHCHWPVTWPYLTSLGFSFLVSNIEILVVINLIRLLWVVNYIKKIHNSLKRVNVTTENIVTSFPNFGHFYTTNRIWVMPKGTILLLNN